MYEDDDKRTILCPFSFSSHPQPPSTRCGGSLTPCRPACVHCHWAHSHRLQVSIGTAAGIVPRTARTARVARTLPEYFEQCTITHGPHGVLARQGVVNVSVTACHYCSPVRYSNIPSRSSHRWSFVAEE
jgi:hypothetical protein